MYKIFKEFPLPERPEIPQNEINILDFGVKNDGICKNTQAIENAIDKLSASGGGKLIFPEGKYLTGPIVFKDNIELHLKEGAEILFSTDFEDFMPPRYMQRGGVRCYAVSPLLYSYKVKNIAVTGKGTLNGNGHFWWPMQQNQPGMDMLADMCKNRTPLEERVFDKIEYGIRPPFIQFLNSENILIEGVTVINSPSWTIHPVYCKNIIISGITLNSPVEAKNSDGIDPDSCENVLIENCRIHTGDDAFALKAGRNEDAWDVNIPTKNVLVRNCDVTMSRGGLSVGSEMSAGVENVLFENCTLDDTNGGIRLKANRVRGGYIRNIECRNITLKKMNQQAIQLTLRYSGCNPVEGCEDRISHLENVYIENVTCESAPVGIEVSGLKERPVKNVTIKNVRINADVDKIIEDVENVITEN